MLPKLYINPGSTFVRNKENPVSTPSRSSLTSSKYSKKEAASAPSRGSLTSPRDRSSTPTRASLYGTTFKPSSKEDYSYLPYKKYLDRLSPEMQKAVVDMRYTESRHNYSIENLNSSAGGIDQFLDSWEPDIIKHANVKNKKEFLNSPEAQDKFFFDYYLPEKVTPAVKRLKKYTSEYSDEELFKMYHFQGERGAREYLSGESGETPQGDLNMPINEYLVSSKKRNKKALGGYLGNNGPKPKSKPKPKPKKTYNSDNTSNETGWLDKIDNVLSAPARAATWGVTKLLTGEGKYEDPSDALGIDEKEHPYLKLATDIALDPTNLLGVGLLSKIGKLAKGAKILKSSDKVLDVLGNGTKVVERTKDVFQPQMAEVLKTMLKTPAGVSASAWMGGRRLSKAAKPFWNQFDTVLAQVYKKVPQARKTIELGLKDGIGAISLINDLISQHPEQAGELNKLKSSFKSEFENSEKDTSNYTNNFKPPKVGKFGEDGNQSVYKNVEKLKPRTLFPDIQSIKQPNQTPSIQTNVPKGEINARLEYDKGDYQSYKRVIGSEYKRNPDNSYGQFEHKYTGGKWNMKTNEKKLGGYLGNNKPKYKKEFGGVLSTLSGAASGAAAGNSLLPGGIGAAGGGALGLITSVAGNIKDAKIKKRIASREKANLDMQFQNNSEAAYSSYLPVNTGGFYAKGGNIPQPESYEAEKGEVVLGDPQLEDGKQLAEGVHEVGGNKHSEGGTQGVGGDFIFSDALLVPESDFQILKTLGLGLKGKKTYADMAKVIGKFKGKYDRNSNNYRKNNTDAEMSKRIEDSLMLLAQSQEELKGTMGEGQNNYALGGTPKNAINKLTGVRPKVTIDYADFYNKLYPNKLTGVPIVSNDLKNPEVMNSIKPTGIDANKSRFNELPKSLPKFDSPKSENNTQGKNKIPSGVLSSTAGYLNDLNTANNIDTDIPLYITPKSRLDYTDRSGYMMDRNNQALNNFTNTRTGTPKNLQGAYAATLKANNQVGLAEAERQDKAVTDYNNKNMYIDSQTAQQYNRNAYLENNLVNTKNENVGGSFSSYLGNLDTVRREQNTMELDNKRLEIFKQQTKLRPGIGETYEEMFKKLQNFSTSTTN